MYDENSLVSILRIPILGAGAYGEAGAVCRDTVRLHRVHIFQDRRKASGHFGTSAEVYGRLSGTCAKMSG